jgi:DNA processing protein
VPGIGRTIARRICTWNGWKAIEEEMAYYRSEDVALLTADDDLYPPPLAQIYDPPCLLFTKGSLQPLEKCLAVIGSRTASTYGMFVTERLCRELAWHGVTVVSGMARGIDTAAHRGAIAGKGRTLAVLGNGINIVYPPENSSLAQEIVSNGALITEYRRGIPPHRDHFPRRNRIISGLSMGVVVVEAGERSGSLITARLALEQDREVFAVPGMVDSPGSRGTHKLLKDGAKLVETVHDILDEILPQLENKPVAAGQYQDAPAAEKEEKRKISPPQKDSPDLTADEASLLALLTPSPREADELITLSGISCKAIQPILMMLEIKGHIQKMPGAKYMLKE